MHKKPMQSGFRAQGGLGRLLRRRFDPVPPPACPDSVAVSGVELPVSSDWGWRPEPWSAALADRVFTVEQSDVRLGRDVSVFHDATAPHASIEQSQGDASSGSNLFGIALDIGAFDGTFLSLAVDLPSEGVLGLTRDNLVGVSLDILPAPGQQMFARFSLVHGPNTEQLLREIPQMNGEPYRQVVEFDLAYIEMNEKRVTRAWIDLILQDPNDSQTLVGDLVIYRRPRAAL